MVNPSQLSQYDAQLQQIMSQTRRIFFAERRHLSENERQRQWELVVNASPSKMQNQDDNVNTFAPTQPTSMQSTTAKRRRVVRYLISSWRSKLTAQQGNGTAQASQTIYRDPSPPDYGQVMCRKRSNASNLSSKPPLPTINTHTQNSSETLDNWLEAEPPFTAFQAVQSPRALPVPVGRRHSRPQPVTVPVKSFDPADYCNQLPLQSPANASNSFNSPRLLWSHTRNPSSACSSSPAYDCLMSPLDLSTNPTSAPMSRQTSKASNSFCKGMSDMRLATNMSRGPSSMSHNPNHPAFTDDTSNPTVQALSSFDAHQVLSHTGGAADNKKLLDAFLDAGQGLMTESDVKMERTSSAESYSSNMSRLSRRSREQVASAERKSNLAAKGSPAPSKPVLIGAQYSQASSQAMSRTSSNGSQNPQIAIPRVPYTRPTHDKIKCDQCERKPEGYRGEHELRRHQKSAHGKKRKVWVCIDASDDQQFLAGCEHCRSFKRYNAYYNAAAHLRRKHFNAKPKGEKKKKGKLLPEEKRGGKGGGTEPPMEVLKKWMHEFEEHADGEPVHPADFAYRRRPRVQPQEVEALEYAPEFDAENLNFAVEDYNDMYQPRDPGMSTQHTWTDSTPTVVGDQSSFASSQTYATSAMPSQSSPDPAPIYGSPAASPGNNPRLFNTTQSLSGNLDLGDLDFEAMFRDPSC